MAANGVYGINVPVNIDIENDIDIFYTYSRTRTSDDVNQQTYEKLSAPSLLSKPTLTESANGYDKVIEGMYNLKLPTSIFSSPGFYTIYLKPREIPVVLQDVGVLSTYEDVKGLVIDSTSVGDSKLRTLLTTNNSLVGYRVIYLDDNLNRQDYYRIITSNNKVEPVVQNLSNVNQKAIRYRYNEVSTLVFLTLTPSVANTFKPNALPYIGSSSQKCLLVNTKFEPIMIEIEMTEHDMETISNILEGSQLRDLDNGLVTTFNDNNEIYSQSEHYTLKDPATGKPIYEVRKKKTDSIDFTQTITDKI